MAGTNEETMDTQVEQTPSDPWAMAFAALDKEDETSVEADAADDVPGQGDEDLPDAERTDNGANTDAPEAGDGDVDEVAAGGLGVDADDDGVEDDGFDWSGIDTSEDGVKSYRDKVIEDVRQRTLTDVVNAYIKQGARNTNGRLGANINDPDVCKRDSDGVPRFYNPETGREFTGDNPRRQAQEWVDDYNRELAEAFNKTCADYSRKLMDQESSRLAVVEFAPKYRQLDPMRRSMFEAFIEDYEVRDKDDRIVGYTCDLNKALAAVNRQVRAIQQRYNSHQQSVSQKTPTGPALDTPTVGSAPQGEQTKPQFKSIAEAMEWQQDQLLAKMRNKKGSR